MSIADIVEQARTHLRCTVLPPDSRVVARREDAHVPNDVAQFYALCGGVELFAGHPGELTILPADEVVPANLVVVGDAGDNDEVSRSAYLIARTSNGDFLSVDLSAARNGRI